MSILGMNRRNALIQRFNPPRSIKSVNQKYETKEKLAATGVPVPPTIALVGGDVQLADIDYASLPEAFAIKPNRGSQGKGVMLVDGRCDDGWQRLNGEAFTYKMLDEHIRLIQEGEYSLDGVDGDEALIEPLIRTHPDMARLVPYGLPDIRIICMGDRPLMAMTRLPTEESSGRANLHQGAVGAAIDLRDGSIFRAVLAQAEIFEHPSTGARLIGQQIPFWDEVVEAARRCSDALDLGYVGVDLVIDAVRGVQVLECNAYPGLEIQNVNGAGLASRIEWVERLLNVRQRAPRAYSLLSLGAVIRTFRGRYGQSVLVGPYARASSIC
jgi:alpha-L-glutamate ligase-like protein